MKLTLQLVDIMNLIKVWFGLALLLFLTQKCKTLKREQKIPNRTKIPIPTQFSIAMYDDKSLDTFENVIKLSFSIRSGYLNFQKCVRGNSRNIC